MLRWPWKLRSDIVVLTTAVAAFVLCGEQLQITSFANAAMTTTPQPTPPPIPQLHDSASNCFESKCLVSPNYSWADIGFNNANNGQDAIAAYKACFSDGGATAKTGSMKASCCFPTLQKLGHCFLRECVAGNEMPVDRADLYCCFVLLRG